MADLETGMLVQHATLGLGKVVAVEANAVHIFFPDGDQRYAAKLRLPNARALLRTDGVEPNAWLQGLNAFALDPKMGRYALAANWLTEGEAIEQFLAVFPGGCTGDAYVSGKRARASRWREVQATWTRLLGDGDLARLLDNGDFKKLSKHARELEAAVAPLYPASESDAPADAFSNHDLAHPFWTALVDMLSVPSPARARIEKVFSAARGLEVEPSRQWLLATLFPFLASPGRQVVVLPGVAFTAAARLGCEVGDDSTPNVGSYLAVRALGARLLEALQPHGATDFVDVECFLHVTATAKRRARSAR